jgi:uncharacterized membrane protein
MPEELKPLIERSLEDRRRHARDIKRIQRARKKALDEKKNPVIDASEFCDTFGCDAS